VGIFSRKEIKLKNPGNALNAKVLILHNQCLRLQNFSKALEFEMNIRNQPSSQVGRVRFFCTAKKRNPTKAKWIMNFKKVEIK
jgi:hypothetical protein